MKLNLIAAAMAAAFFAAPVLAQQSAHEEHHASGAQGAFGQRDGAMMGGMGGMGGGMMDGGMMGAYSALGLSDEQRARIADIERELAARQREATAKLQGARSRMHGLLAPGSVDEAAARTAYEELSAARKALFEAMLAARTGTAAVLTEEQRAQLRNWGRCPAMESQS